MRKNLFSYGIVLLFAFAACNTAEKEGEFTNKLLMETKPTNSSPAIVQPTEKFTGMEHGAPLVFEHKDYTHYHLLENGKDTVGALNTERGFEDDKDATVYVLNDDKPENEQKYFVRFTDGTISMLDSSRKVIAGVELVKVKSEE